MFIYPSLLTQGKRKCRIALNMHELSEAQIFVYRQNLTLELTMRLTLCPSTVLRGKRHGVVFVEYTCSLCCPDEFTGTVISVCQPGNKTEIVLKNVCLILTSLPCRRFHAPLKAGNYRPKTCQESLDGE
jgi:hypothetical protein